MSLKVVLNSILIVLAALILAAAASLGLVTKYLQRVAASLETSVEGVRFAEELEVELLTHYRRGFLLLPSADEAQSTLLGQSEARLQKLLEEVQPLATTPEEQALMREVHRQVMAYVALRREANGRPPALVAREAGSLLDEAVATLERLVEYNVQEARLAQAQARRWERLGRLGGTALVALLLVSLIGALVWLRRAVLRPVTQVSQAMRRFGSGRKRTRAPEAGPTELREMARTFNEMASSLVQKQEDELTFLAGVAHDLRNPLSALKMSVALVDPDKPDASPARVQKMITLVRRQVARLDRMVGDLLDATRIEAGKLELKLEERDARELARGVVELYQASGSNHELSLSLPESPVLLFCDGTRMEQVLNNLVSNALKYSPQGKRVDVTVHQEGEEALLCVTDQGIGMSAEEQRHIFAPYRRGRRARERAPGVGLGLSVARRIIEAHGGRIEVESRLGQGSVFRVRLPLSRAAQTLLRPPGPSPAWTPGGAVH
ncbi:MAG: HAMP domain-containing protein [Myxococcaceae bacterium]|nr:HAMP domain-containing protein [Myxococcaceae bacterium]